MNFLLVFVCSERGGGGATGLMLPDGCHVRCLVEEVQIRYVRSRLYDTIVQRTKMHTRVPSPDQGGGSQ